MACSGWKFAGFGLIALGACQPGGLSVPAPNSSAVRFWSGVEPTSAIPSDRVVMSQSILVPIYSNIATADNARAINLAVTLTVRNLDPKAAIVIPAIKYHDSGGRLVRDWLDQPVRIGPLGSLDLFVRESDNSGGPSPSFLVECVAEQDVIPAQADAVMISTAGSLGITLTSSGRVIESHHR